MKALQQRSSGSNDTLDSFLKEFRAFEHRLNDRLDLGPLSTKEYIDSRISQVSMRIDELDGRIGRLEAKLDRSVRGLVDLIERGAVSTERRG